ncbi:MAG: PorV/PorQ family protein [Elusimicrobia bacterium]|nr:PorV/PorQ family protein [Candidatus Liberimonas magnetica]
MKKVLAVMISLVILAGQSTVFAAGSNAGKSTAQFLQLGVGARAEGLGEAYTALTDGAESVYWNPAGLAGMGNNEVTFTQAMWIDDISYQFIAGAFPTKAGTFAIGLKYLSYGKIQKTDSTGLEIGDFSPNDLMAGVSYGRGFGKLKAGGTVKYISSKITNTATAMALDLGLKYPFMNDQLNLGLAAVNMGSKMKFISEEDPLPMTVKLGASCDLGGMWLCAVDVNMPNDDDVFANAGVEKKFKVNDMIALAGRVGYNTRTKDITGTKGITAGLGLDYKQANYGKKPLYITLDAAYAPYGDLGSITLLSLGVKF